MKIINQLKENLQNHKYCIVTRRDQITKDTMFINKFVSQVKELHVDFDFSSFDNIEELTKALCSSNVKVCLQLNNYFYMFFITLKVYVETTVEQLNINNNNC